MGSNTSSSPPCICACMCMVAPVDTAVGSMGPIAGLAIAAPSGLCSILFTRPQFTFRSVLCEMFRDGDVCCARSTCCLCTGSCCPSCSLPRSLRAEPENMCRAWESSCPIHAREASWRSDRVMLRCRRSSRLSLDCIVAGPTRLKAACLRKAIALAAATTFRTLRAPCMAALAARVRD